MTPFFSKVDQNKYTCYFFVVFFFSIDVKNIASIDNDYMESTNSGNFQNHFFLVKFHICNNKTQPTFLFNICI